MYGNGKSFSELYLNVMNPNFSIQFFKAKLELCMGQLRVQDTSHFPKLESVSIKKDFNNYADVLQNLYNESSSRFQRVVKIDTELNSVAVLFQFKVHSAPADL